MATVLHVEASPRKQRSASVDVSTAFLTAYAAAHPDDTIRTLDVWSLDLPEFDSAAFEAKYAGIEGRELTPAQKAVWDRFVAHAQPFLSADKFVFSIPMWNWGIPYKLKHLIDVISMKDVLFTFDERGLNGLLKDRKAMLVLAKGVGYETASPFNAWETQTLFMTVWLQSIGITDVTVVNVEKTLFGPDVDANSREAAKREALAHVARF